MDPNETSYEAQIRDNIQRIQQNIRSLNEQLDRVSRTASSLVSLRSVQSLQELLRQTHATVQDTENAFRNWTVHLSSEPFERQRKKFSVEKLTRHLDSEVGALRQVAKRVGQVEGEFKLRQQREAERHKLLSPVPPDANKSSGQPGRSPGGQEMASSDSFLRRVAGLDEPGKKRAPGKTPSSGGVDLTQLGDTGSAGDTGGGPLYHQHPGAGEETGLLDIDGEEEENADAEALMQDVVVNHAVARERAEGIQRIQKQVTEVNQIFRDLAEIVVGQDQQIRTIESSVDLANTHTRKAVSELKRAHDYQKTSRDRNCSLLMVVVVVLFLLLYTHTQHAAVTLPSAALAAVGAAASSSSSAIQLPPALPVEEPQLSPITMPVFLPGAGMQLPDAQVQLQVVSQQQPPVTQQPTLGLPGEPDASAADALVQAGAGMQQQQAAANAALAGQASSGPGLPGGEEPAGPPGLEVSMGSSEVSLSGGSPFSLRGSGVSGFMRMKSAPFVAAGMRLAEQQQPDAAVQVEDNPNHVFGQPVSTVQLAGKRTEKKTHTNDTHTGVKQASAKNRSSANENA